MSSLGMCKPRKRCRICKKNKPLDQFHKNARVKDGRQTYCKKCRIDKYFTPKMHLYIEKNKKWAKDNRERHNEITRRWARANKSYFKEYQRRRSAKVRAQSMLEMLVRYIIMRNNHLC